MQQRHIVIAAANQKYSVGKPTAIEYPGIVSARNSKKVLMIDLDPRANLTSCLGWQNVDALDHTVCDVMEASIRKEECNFSDILLHHDEGADLLPSGIKLPGYMPGVAGMFTKEQIQANGIEDLIENYDCILIDCSGYLLRMRMILN